MSPETTPGPVEKELREALSTAAKAPQDETVSAAKRVGARVAGIERAQNLAILRIAREIDDLKARVGP